jgi:hypothetical protein
MDRVIKPLIGEENLKKIKTDLYNNPSNYNDWIKFEKSIEEFKISFQNIEQIEKSCEIDCELFSDFLDTERIDNFNKNNKWQLSTKKNSYKINFIYQIVYDFTLEIVNKAVDLISQIISNNKDIDTLICGRATLTNIIYNIFSDRSSLKNIHLIRGENPEVSIAFGSIFFALDPFDVALRKAKKKQ